MRMSTSFEPPKQVKDLPQLLFVCWACLVSWCFMSSPGIAQSNQEKFDYSGALQSLLDSGRYLKAPQRPILIGSGDKHFRFLSMPTPGKFAVEIEQNVQRTADHVAHLFLEKHGSLLHDPSSSVGFRTKGVKAVRGKSYVKTQQTYATLPIFSAEVIVQTDSQLEGVECVISDILRQTAFLDSGRLSLFPSLTPFNGRQAAIAFMHEQSPAILLASLQTTSPTLMIYAPSVIGSKGNQALVWQTIVADPTETSVNEVVLVDAHSGEIVFQPLLGNQWARTRGECPPRCTFSTVYPPNGPVHFCVRVQDWRGISSGRQREPESAPDAQVTFQRWSPSLRKRISTHPLVFVKSRFPLPAGT